MARLAAVLIVAAGLLGCQETREATSPDAAARPNEQTPRTNENLHSVLYTQTAVEYAALTRQSYRLARLMLDRALDDPTWTAALEQTGDVAELPPAVVVDVDETVLDNSPYQARLVQTNSEYSTESWQAWVREVAADPVPGALSFARYADRNGVTVFYVTNRDYAAEDATRRNLRELGFPLAGDDDVILTRGERKSWDGSKTPRREMLAEEYRILLLVGDNFGDFAPGVETGIAERRRLAERYDAYWGERWIVLPNPQYGSWEGALYDYNHSLTRQEKLERKYEHLETKE